MPIKKMQLTGNNPKDSLTLELHQFDSRVIEGITIVDFTFKLSVTTADGFSGWSYLYVCNSIPGFVDALRAYDKTLNGSAEISSPYGDEYSAYIRVFNYDKLGNTGVQVKLTNDRAGESSRAPFKLHAEFRFDPNQIAPFANELERIYNLGKSYEKKN